MLFEMNSGTSIVRSVGEATHTENSLKHYLLQPCNQTHFKIFIGIYINEQSNL